MSQNLKVLFLSSDTGGGHRASAESLARQFELIYPGSTYDLLDVMEKDGVLPYSSLVSSYKHLSRHPSQWKLVYSISNSRAYEMIFDVHNKLMCERAIRKRIMAYNPDLVISVHPMMTNVPIASCAKINKKTGRHLPIFTVVTDLGSAHCLWFANGVDKMYIASDEIRELAKERGKVPDDKLVQIGLPIRHQFSHQADLLGDRMSIEGIRYQKIVRQNLKLPFYDRKTILVMGGGEGVGSLSNIVDSLYVELQSKGIDAIILVVCGRNEILKNELKERNWKAVLSKHLEAKENGGGYYFSSCMNGHDDLAPGLLTSQSDISEAASLVGCIEGSVTRQFRRILGNSSLTNVNAITPVSSIPNNSPSNLLLDESKEKKSAVISSSLDSVEEKSGSDVAKDKVAKNLVVLDNNGVPEIPGNIDVVGLGFVTNMAEYMVSADVLVSKAGPGTIAEAAALSLPVLLTSFLPGQEEGNVDFVIKGKFGAFVPDTDPTGISEEVALWLSDSEKFAYMSKAAKAQGAPNAARDIVKDIGDLALKWKKINKSRDEIEKEAQDLLGGTTYSSDTQDKSGLSSDSE